MPAGGRSRLGSARGIALDRGGRGHSIRGPQGEVSGPAAASPEKLLEEEILRSHLRPIRSDTLGGGNESV